MPKPLLCEQKRGGEGPTTPPLADSHCTMARTWQRWAGPPGPAYTPQVPP
jgi:hypothetical protein